MSARRANKGRDSDRLLLDQIADRWTILVLRALCNAHGRLRFNALRRAIPGVSQKTLTQCLRRLERNGLVERRLIDGAPPGVEYATTALGDTLEKPFEALKAWTSEHAAAVRSAQAKFDASATAASALRELPRRELRRSQPPR